MADLYLARKNYEYNKLKRWIDEEMARAISAPNECIIDSSSEDIDADDFSPFDSPMELSDSDDECIILSETPAPKDSDAVAKTKTKK